MSIMLQDGEYTLVRTKFVNRGDTSMAYPNPGGYKDMALTTCAAIRNVPTQITFSPDHHQEWEQFETNQSNLDVGF